MSEEFNYEDFENEDNENLNIQKEEAKKYLTFLSDGLTFAVNANSVSEIITNHHITILPMVPLYIQGIINLRGQIIPIIDIRMRMNKPSLMEDNGTSCIIVLDINGVSVGIFVDTVSQVTDVYESNISPMPANSSQELVNGMMSLPDGKVILFLDCELLLRS